VFEHLTFRNSLPTPKAFEQKRLPIRKIVLTPFVSEWDRCADVLSIPGSHCMMVCLIALLLLCFICFSKGLIVHYHATEEVPDGFAIQVK
jgi:hypothetical protein